MLYKFENLYKSFHINQVLLSCREMVDKSGCEGKGKSLFLMDWSVEVERQRCYLV